MLLNIKISLTEEIYDFDINFDHLNYFREMMFDFDDMDTPRGKSSNNKNAIKKSKEQRFKGESLSNNKEKVKESYEIKQRREKQFSQIVEQEGLKWQSGSCTKLGPRSSNEDRLVALPNLVEAVYAAKRRSVLTSSSTISASSTTVGNHNGNNYNSSSQASIMSNSGGRESERQGYFAVYDGHCGAQASTHLQESLHLSIFNHPLYHTDIQTAIIESCIATDKAFLAESREKKQYSGTTALGAIVRGNELTVFNIGDCHAVLCCNGAALDMSDPHKPNRPDEAARILAAKGWITEEKELYMARLHRMDLSDPVVRDKAQHVSWVTIHRVCGEISVSRSIGDPDYKSFQPGEKVDAFFIWPDGHNQVRIIYILILFVSINIFDVFKPSCSTI